MNDDRYEAGMRVRREVLGDEHVDRATASTGIDADFQRWLTESAWGALWTLDDQLDRRTRSCVTIAVLTALRADEIAEVIMHTAAYAGLPAANAAMAVAKAALADPDTPNR